jgi:hypothetical protein
MRYQIQTLTYGGAAPQLAGEADDETTALRTIMLPLLQAKQHHSVYQVDTQPELQIKPAATEAERVAMRALMPKTFGVV